MSRSSEIIHPSSNLDDDVLINVDNVSKKFCRDFKKSLWYGLKDTAADILHPKHKSEDSCLRPSEFWANQNISFEVKRGECLGLIGHNGAGKTTLLKMLSGLIKPDTGSIEMRGRVGALIALGSGFNPILTGRENIYVNGSILGLQREEIDAKLDEIIDFAEIEDAIDAPVRTYSSGMQVRLGFSVASSMQPDILIIDEVLAVGDMGFRVKCLNRIHELLDTAAVIFVSHSMPFVSRICSRGILMKNGEATHQSGVVADIIDIYNAEFDGGEQSVVGSGEVEVKSVRQIGGNGAGVVNYGERLQIETKLSVNSSAKRIAVRLLVSDLQQRAVMDFVNEDHLSFVWDNDASELTLTMTSPPLTLAGGKHTVAIGVYDHDSTRVLCRMDNALWFVMGEHISTGCGSFLPVEWKLEKK